MFTKKQQEEESFDESNPAFSMIADFDGNEKSFFESDMDEVMPVLPLRNMVLFPTVVMPVTVGRKSSLKLIQNASADGKQIAVFCQKDPDVENPGLNDLYSVGVLAKVIRVFDMPDQTTTVVLQGMQRIKLLNIINDRPYLVGTAELFPEVLPPTRNKEFKAIVDSCKDAAIKYVKLSDNIQPDAAFALKNISNGMFLINFMCSNLPFDIKDKARLLREGTCSSRALTLLSLLNREIQLAELKVSIQRRTHEDIEKQQKEYFLQQELKNIQDELGGSVQDQDIEEMRIRANQKKWSEEVRKIFDKELLKLERTNSQSPDYNVQLSYLQTVLSLPWGEYTKDNLDMGNARRALDKDHYGLEKVKERIMEHLAVMKLRGDFKSPILCLYGPPGVGKTSLGLSIANALKRKYVRISLGGLHDEAEIRGHRKTYIGAMPGRIIKGLIKAGSSNPVFILDEIDKVSQMTTQGDPSSAMLEVLDPEQNNAFHDNYLDIDYDLSKVMFIATANNINTIPAPLLDRMELIEVSGYITEEKIEIAKRHLIPKEMEANGLAKGSLSIGKAAIESIIENYTRESGVRELDKKIGKICRKTASKYATDGDFGKMTVKPDDLKELLGTRPYSRDKYQGNEYAGVVTGLAWTAVGGEILFVETSLSRGKEGKLTLTGNLGDVMKESAMLAMEYIRAHARLLNLDPAVFNSWNVHIHVPEGAIPKDGPSAGITMATSIASAFTQRKVRPHLAMTGEITLRGKVLPVGGIREKILAAKRAGITDIILCSENRRDIEEIPADYLKGVEFHYVNNISEVWKIALLDEKVADAQDITPILQSEK
ncbi:MAG: endopeptidase La [Bacteroidaceae bacterium]|nr:endopeptidase La [Bacteroidaceae bacterium]